MPHDRTEKAVAKMDKNLGEDSNNIEILNQLPEKIAAPKPIPPGRIKHKRLL